MALGSSGSNTGKVTMVVLGWQLCSRPRKLPVRLLGQEDGLRSLGKKKLNSWLSHVWLFGKYYQQAVEMSIT